MSNPQLHDNLLALFQKLQPLGAIANIVARTIKSTLNPTDKIISCFYLLEKGEEVLSEEQAPVFGSCDIVLITTGRFIRMGFYPTYHTYTIKNIARIDEIHVENRFSTGYEGEGEAANAEERGYNPIEIKLDVHFVNERGEKSGNWEEDVTRFDDIKLLYKEIQVLGQYVGQSLSDIVG